MDTSTETPYTRLGGRTGIEQVVAELYLRVWDDPELGPFFHRTDRATQRDRLTDLLSEALGGPDGNSRAGLREAHAGRGITHRHFSLLASHAVDVLSELGADDEVVDDLLDFFTSVRADVVDDRR